MRRSAMAFALGTVVLLAVGASCARPARGTIDAQSMQAATIVADDAGARAQVLRGRQEVLEHDCNGCHGGASPADTTWLRGQPNPDTTFFKLGPFMTYPRNLTPDSATGTGTYTERQIFNALRYGLSPRHTPDMEITSSTPGVGNHPANPRYLAPTMPWPSWRHMSDQSLRDIAAYLKRGVKPAHRRIPDSQTPPDFWLSENTPDKIGPYPALPFPTAHERSVAAADLDIVLRGRQEVLEHACGACHGGGDNPASPFWLDGVRDSAQIFAVGPFKTRPRNLTPDNLTGLGRFTERQIFNALRFGLRPGETPDVEITSMTPGVGNFPMNPKYLAPPMPWPGWRHMADADIMAIAAYLKRSVKPSTNRVADSEGPPDFWARLYTVQSIGPYPAPPFPTAHERVP